MRRFPGCWTDILPSLGFRRVLKSANTETNRRRRRSQIEQLEPRQMLSASPLEETFVVDIAASLESPTAQFATLGGEALPTIDTAALPTAVADIDSRTDVPVRVEYVLANPGRGNNPNQFRIETQYDEQGAARAVVRLLESELGGGKLDTTLQELHLELRAGSAVLERQEILIDIADADFRAKFLADRVTAARGSTAYSTPESVLTGLTTSEVELTEPAEMAGLASEEDNRLNAQSDTTTSDQRRQKLADLTTRSNPTDIAEIVKLESDHGDVLVSAADSIKLFDALTAALATSAARVAGAAGEEEAIRSEKVLLGQSTLLLAETIAEQLASGDTQVRAAAERLRDQAIATVGGVYTLFTGLAKNQELRRTPVSSESGESVIGAIEEGTYQANATLRIELGAHQALVQVTRRMGASSTAKTAPALIGLATLIGDTYTDGASGANFGQSNSLIVSGGAGPRSAYLQFDLSPYVGANLSAATLKLTAVAGAANHQVTAYKDLFSSPLLWNEDNLTGANAAAIFTAGFSSTLATWNSSAAGSIDVSEAVRRAALLGDSNASGALSLNGPRGDVEAFYWSIVDPTTYATLFSAANPESIRRNDINWDGILSTQDVSPMFARLGMPRADFNFDGVTDLRDFAVWQTNYVGTIAPNAVTGGFSLGDGDFSGVLDIGDFGLWSTTSSGSNGFAAPPMAPSVTLRVDATDSSLVTYHSGETGATSPTLSVTREFVVNSLEDGGDSGSLGDGVADANPNAFGDQVTLRAAIQEINALATANPGMKFAISFAPEVRGVLKLGSELVITAPVSIQGPGAELLTLSGSGANRLINVSTATTVAVRGLTLADGYTTYWGGAVFSYGDLTLENVAVRNSRAELNGGGVAIAGTGGKLTLRASTIDGNQAGVAGFGSGGGLFIWAERDDALVIDRSTISRNVADEAGGLFFAGAGTSVAEKRKGLITNSTISGNSAPSAGGVRVLWNTALVTIASTTITANRTDAFAGGLDLSAGGQAILTSSIVAGNLNSLGGPNNLSRASNAAWDAQNTANRDKSTRNLFGNSGTDGWTAGNVNQNQVIPTADPLLANDPKLSPLGSYGGPTETHLPLAGSLAINTGAPIPERTAYTTKLLADKPTAHYSFDGHGNSTVPTAPSAVLQSGAYFPTNPVEAAAGSSAVKVDANGFAQISNLTIGQSFSFEMWAKSDTPTWNVDGWLASARQKNGFLISPHTSPNGNGKGWSAFILDNSFTNSNQQYPYVGTHYPDDIEGWHHYALTYDYASGKVVMYFDGKVVVTNSITQRIRAASDTITLNLGRDIYFDTNTNSYVQTRNGDGAMDEAAIYDYALSPAQIAARVASDQRGAARSPSAPSGRADIGAVESYPSIVSGADFDGDGRTDEVFQDPVTRALYVTTGSPTARTVANWGQLGEVQSNAALWKVGDFDGDGRDDLAIRRSTGSWSIALSESTRFKVFDAAPAPLVALSLLSWDVASTFVGDFDGDGRDELLGRTTSTAAWERWVYRDEAGPSVVAAGTSLTGTGQTLYVGDANRDGRDDIIANVTANGEWRVSLSTLSGSAVTFGAHSVWNNWFTGGANFSADGKSQKLLDIFSDVYNNVELEIYPGLMKGPTATDRTKAGNDWDQAALMVEKLRTAGFNDAQIVESQVDVAWQQLRDWLGVLTNEAALSTISAAVDSSVALLAGNVGVRFRHAFVQVTAPTATGFSTINLDPSWKFKTRQDGLAINLTQATTGYTVPSGMTASGTFDELFYLKTSQTNESPLAWYEGQLMSYLAGVRTTAPLSLADLAFDGPIAKKSFTKFSELNNGLAIASAINPVGTLADVVNSVLPPTDPNYANSKATKYAHQARITVPGGTTQTFVVAALTNATTGAPSTFSITYTAPDAQNKIKPQLWRDGALVPNTTGNGVAAGSSITFNISHVAPASLSPAMPTQAASKDYIHKAGRVHSIAFEANQYSRQDIESLTKRVIDVAADGAQNSDIDEFTDLTIASYWELYNREMERVDATMRTLGTQQWVGSGMVSADNGLLTNSNPYGGGAPYTTDQVKHLPFGIVPWNLGIDLPNTNGPSIDIATVNAANWSSKEANQLKGWTSSYLENTILEAGIYAESISTVRGLKYAYAGATANVVPPTVTPLTNPVTYAWPGGVQRDNRVLVFESTSAGAGQARTVYFRGYVGNSSGPWDDTLATYSATNTVAANFTTSGQLRHLPASTRTSIQNLLQDTSAVGFTRVIVPERPSRVGQAGQGWDGVVYVSELETPTSSAQGYIIAPLNSSETLAGGISLNQPQPVSETLPVANFDRAAYAGDPVNVANGNMFRDETDFEYQNLGFPLSFSRHYDSQSQFDIGLGVGWVHSFSDRIMVKNGSATELFWLTSTGAQLKLTDKVTATGIWKSPESRLGEFKETGGSYFWSGADGVTYEFEKKTSAAATADGASWVSVGRLKSIIDRNGHGVGVGYWSDSETQSSNFYRLYKPSRVFDIHTPPVGVNFGANDRYLLIGPDASSPRIGAVTRYIPGTAADGSLEESLKTDFSWFYNYSSDTNGPTTSHYLADVVRPNASYIYGQTPDLTAPRYVYNLGISSGPQRGLMKTVTEYDGAYHDYEYYPNGRVFRVTESIDLGPTTSAADDIKSSQFFSYDLLHGKTEFTDENRQVETYVHDDKGQLVRQIHADGSLVSFKYGTSANDRTLMTESVDEVGFKESYVYSTSSNPNHRGQLQSSTAKDGVVSTYTYWAGAAPYAHIHELSQVVRTGSGLPTETTIYNLRDSKGNLTKMTSPAGIVTEYTRSSATATAGLVEFESRPAYASGASAIVWQVLSSSLNVQAGEVIVDVWKGTTGVFRADAIRLERMNGTTVVGSWIIDDSDAAFEMFGAASAVSGGFAGGATQINGGEQIGGGVTLNKWGRWTFANLPAGTYRVAATWQATGVTTDVNYSVYNRVGTADNSLGGFPVNQQNAPVGATLEPAHEPRTRYIYDSVGNVVRTSVDGIVAASTEYDLFGAPRITVDAAGVKTYATRDYRGRVLKSGVGEPATKLETQFTYDQLGRVTAVTDPLGRIAQSTYDKKGRLTKETLADGTSIEHTYDGKGNRLTTKDALGRVTKFTYDSRDRVVQTTFADGKSRRVDYDGAGRVQRTVDELGQISELTYDRAGRLLSTTVGKREGVTSTGVEAKSVNKYDALGRLVESVDANRVVTKQVFDNAGRLSFSFVLPGSVTANANDNLLTTIPANTVPVSVVAYKYDADGRLSERHDYDPTFDAVNMTASNQAQLMTDPLNLPSYAAKISAGKIRVTKMVYDAQDRVSRIIQPDGSATATTYDPSGRVQFTKDELGRIAATKYDAYGRLVKTVAPDPDGLFNNLQSSPVSTVTYDAVGNVLTATDPRGVTTRTIYDQFNRAITTTDGIGAKRRSIYDVAGQMVSGIDPHGIATYTQRDDRGRAILTKDVDPDGAGLALAPTNRSTYDAAGNVVQTIDSRGFATNYTYDARNRLIKETPTVSRVADNSNTPNLTSVNATNNLNLDDEFKLLQGTISHEEGILGAAPYGRDQSQVTGFAGQAAKVQWDFKGLEAGDYQLYLTWSNPSTTFDSGAIPDILVNGVLQSWTLPNFDQREWPKGVYREDSRSRSWASVIKMTGVPAGATVSFTLTGSSATSTIAADAVMLESLTVGTSYSYDRNGNRVLTTDARGNSTRYQFDELNRSTAKITTDPDVLGNLRSLVTWTSYNGFGEVTKSRTGNQNATNTNLAGAANPTLAQATLFADTAATFYRTDSFMYDQRGRLVNEMLADGSTAEVENRYYYDAAGKETLEVQAYGSIDEVVTLRDYDGLDRLTKQVVDIGRSTEAQARDGANNDLAGADPNTALSHGAKVQRQTTYTYDAAGNVLDTAVKAFLTAPVITSRNVYDNNGRLIRSIADVGGMEAVTSTAFDLRGQMTVSVDATGRRTFYAYDDLGRQISTRKDDPDGVGSGQAPASYTQYDSAGNVIAELNGELEPTYFVYDSRGREVRTISPTRLGPSFSGGAAANDTEMLTRYDAVGNVVAMRDGSYNVTTYAYDPLNRKQSQSTWVQAASGGAPLNALTTWTYAIDGRLSRISDPRAAETDVSIFKYNKRGFVYDALDRLIDEQWVIPGSSQTPGNVTVPENNGTGEYSRHNRIVYDKLGRILESKFEIDNNTGFNIRDAYRYDNLGRALEHTSEQPNSVSGATSRIVTSFTYDQSPSSGVLNGLSSTVIAQQITDNDAGVADKQFALVRSYDRLGREVDVRDAGLGTNQALQIATEYDLEGRQESALRKQGAAADVVFASYFGYDRAGRLKSFSHQGELPTELYRSYALTRDQASRITSISSKTAVNGAALIDGYTYDESGRLQNFNEQSDSQASSVTLDDSGNRTDNRVIGLGNRLLEDSQFRYEYDRGGNVIKRITKVGGAYVKFDWDYRDRLLSIREFNSSDVLQKTIAYNYTSENDLYTKKIYNGSNVLQFDERYASSGGERVLIRDATGKVKERLIYGPSGEAPAVDQVFAATGALTSTAWSATDHLGSVRDVTDNAGLLLNRLDYDPYGKITSVTNGSGATISSSARAIDAAFAGEIFDDDAKLALHGARWYDPSAQVFISEDPIAADENLYRYASNDPVNYVDPTGLFTQTPLDYLPALGGGYSPNRVNSANLNLSAGTINAISRNTNAALGSSGASLFNATSPFAAPTNYSTTTASRAPSSSNQPSVSYTPKPINLHLPPPAVQQRWAQKEYEDSLSFGEKILYAAGIVNRKVEDSVLYAATGQTREQAAVGLTKRTIGALSSVGIVDPVHRSDQWFAAQPGIEIVKSGVGALSNPTTWVGAAGTAYNLGRGAGAIRTATTFNHVQDVTPSIVSPNFYNVADSGIGLGVTAGEQAAVRARVLANIAESQKARAASNFDVYIARENQILSGYNADVWQPQTLQPGSIVYGGVPGQTAYYTDLATVKASRLNQRSLFESLQVKPHPEKGYRPAIQAYRVSTEIRVPGGSALNNPTVGIGGGGQYFIPNYDKVLTPIRQFPLSK